jgi:nucleotide-binding universal stress UspA family protein
MDQAIETQLERQKQDYLDGVVRRISEILPGSASSTLMVGDISDTLSRVASSTGVDLIIMTTHARGVAGRLWLGSVADHLIRQSPVPVLLVPPQDATADLTRDHVLRSILIALDGTALAEQILKPALALGRLMDAQYALLRVIKPVASFGHPTQGDPLGQEMRTLSGKLYSIQQQLRKEASDYLEQIAQKLRLDSFQVKTMVAEEHQPGVAIAHEAVPPSFDCIALETHGRRGISRMILGSVADKVVRGASLPILLHRPIYQ